MIKREILLELKNQLKEFPVVTILGPRQAGKTTLAKSIKGYEYVNLEHPEVREFATIDPKAFLKPYTTKKVVIDEIQRVPELLSYIQILVDEKKINGHFILTGSHQLHLHNSIAQSLAGRTGILTLFPLSIKELKSAGYDFDFASEYIFKGFLPRVYDQNQRPTSTYSAYYKTYVDRDVTQMIQLKEKALFERFIKLLAGRTGQLFDYQNLANATGVSQTTVKNWLSILESSFIIFKIMPFYENFGKRLVKTPKYYFVEPGLLTYLLQIHEQSQLDRDPLYGQIFENLILSECVKHKLNQGKDHNIYFFRDSNGNEVDVFHKLNGNYYLGEIKSSMTFHKDFLKNLNSLDKKIEVHKKALIFSGESRTLKEKTKLLNFKDSSEFFS